MCKLQLGHKSIKEKFPAENSSRANCAVFFSLLTLDDQWYSVNRNRFPVLIILALWRIWMRLEGAWEKSRPLGHFWKFSDKTINRDRGFKWNFERLNSKAGDKSKKKQKKNKKKMENLNI